MHSTFQSLVQHVGLCLDVSLNQNQLYIIDSRQQLWLSLTLILSQPDFLSVPINPLTELYFSFVWHHRLRDWDVYFYLLLSLRSSCGRRVHIYQHTAQQIKLKFNSDYILQREIDISLLFGTFAWNFTLQFNQA